MRYLDMSPRAAKQRVKGSGFPHSNPAIHNLVEFCKGSPSLNRGPSDSGDLTLTRKIENPTTLHVRSLNMEMDLTSPFSAKGLLLGPEC